MECNSGKTFVDFLWYFASYLLQRSACSEVLCVNFDVWQFLSYGIINCNWKLFQRIIVVQGVFVKWETVNN